MQRAGVGRDRHRLGPLLRDGPRQALGADEARLRRDREHGAREHVGPTAPPRSRRFRRLRRRASPTSSSSRSSSSTPTARRSARCATAIRSSSSTSAPTARGRSRARSRSDDQFDGFARPDRPTLHTTTMTVYDRTFDLPVVFTPQTFSNNLADVLAAHGRTNLRLAETEKYAHVTYFFNCGREEPYAGEDRILVPSQKVADLRPDAGDERAGNRRQPRRRPRRRGGTRSSSATSPTPTWSATPAARRRRSRPSRRSTAAWAGS